MPNVHHRLGDDELARAGVLRELCDARDAWCTRPRRRSGVLRIRGGPPRGGTLCALEQGDEAECAGIMYRERCA